MASFTQDPEEWQRLDWRLLQSSPIALYFNREILKEDLSWFASQRYRVLTMETGTCASAEALLEALGECLSFPAYFGRSIDALNDLLSDIDVPDDGGLVLVLYDFHGFASAFRETAQAILDVFADNSRQFLLTGRRCLVLVHSGDPRIAFEPVGTTAVAWNPREWLNSKRGL